jgi:hypothetical protein
MNKFSIHFNDLFFLSESLLRFETPSQKRFFDKYSDEFYHLMNDLERKQLFEYVIAHHKFNLDNEICEHFYNRFNLENQFLITAEKSLITSTFVAYLHNDKYLTSKSKEVSKKYITIVTKLSNGEIIFKKESNE